MFKKIIKYFLCAVIAVFLIWQGIFWIGEYVKIKKYSSIMQVVSFWDSISYLSKKMPMFGILCRWYDYQNYVAREEQSGRVPKDWKEWNNDWMTIRSQMEEIIEQTYREIKDRTDAEKADIYGGETPEETWALFVDALKKEDFELASRYFVVDKQADYLDLFKSVKEKGQYDDMMADLTASELHKGTERENSIEFSVSGKDKKATVYGKMVRINGKWKIGSM